MTRCTRCGADSMVGVQYALTGHDYDGVSEWRCDACGYRVGRWSGLPLDEGQLEGRYGHGSPVSSGLVRPAMLCGEDEFD